MKKLLLLIILPLICISGYSQVNKFGYPLYKAYSADEIGANAQNWSVAQASNGIIYVANNKSMLLEYDGEEWRKIPIKKDIEIRAVAINDNDIVFVGGAKEFGYLELTENGDYLYKSLSDNLADSLKRFAIIYKINCIGDTVYFSDEISNIYKYVTFSNSIKIIKCPANTLFTFRNKNKIYGGSYTSGLFKIENDSAVITNNGGTYQLKNIFALIDETEKPLIVTGGSGIFEYDEESGNSKSILSTNAMNYYNDAVVYSATYNSNNIFLGSIRKGFAAISKSGDLEAVLGKEIGISDNICASTDNYGNVIWNSLTSSVSAVEYANPIRVFGEESNLNSWINAITIFNNKLFIGTDVGLFYLTYKEDGMPWFKNVEGVEKQIFSLSKIHNKSNNRENLIIGTTAGLYQLESVNKAIKSIEENLVDIKELFPKTEEAKLQDAKLYVYKTFTSSNNLLWVGTATRLIALEFSINKWHVKTKLEVGDRVNSIQEDRNGDIWISTRLAGLTKININESKEEKYNNEEFGIPNFEEIIIDKIGNELVFGTKVGLYQFDNVTNRFKKFENVPVDFTNGEVRITQVLALSDKSLVLNVKYGDLEGVEYLKFNGEEYKADKNSTILKRLKEVASDAICEFDSRLWIANGSKLITYNLNNNFDIDWTYNCLIRKVEGIDTTLFMGNYYAKTENGLMPSDIQNNYQKPEINYSNNDLTFHFAAPFYEADDEIVYSYKLGGFKNNWSKWNNEPKAVFTNVNEGSYTFQVRAKNIYEKQSSIGTFSFTILPPWYRTILAYFIYFVCALLLIWVILKLYTRRLQQEKIRLEGIVRERTAEIREQRDQIAAQKESIEDSIQYASRIQKAILPSNELAEEILPEHFILFRPRDIVSGDYYWMNKIGSKTIVVAADCTGHGVPGAFMSMLGVSFLNEIVLKEQVIEPHKILNKLRERVKKTLKQEGKDGEAKDGMDVALVVIDDNTRKLYFSGAYNPVYIYRDSELIEIKADRMPIGIYIREKESFTLNEFDYQAGDTFYIFSDGYPDQFGGEKGQKFRTKAMKQLIAEIQTKTMSEQREILNSTIENWMGDTEQIDDMVILGVRL